MIIYLIAGTSGESDIRILSRNDSTPPENMLATDNQQPSKWLIIILLKFEGSTNIPEEEVHLVSGNGRHLI
jgi:hypothetical protein